MGDRGDPQGPWQDYGRDATRDERVPAPLPASPPWSDDHSDSYPDDYSDEWGYDEEPGDERGESFFGRAADEVLWRYRSAPLWLRATLDVGAVALVLVAVVAGALTLQGTGPTDEVGAFVAPTSTTVRPAGTPAPLGTTTTSSTTSEPPTTTTTRPPTNTTVAPPTTAVPPPATTTTTRPRRNPDPGPPPHYDNCFQAWRAGALPLYRGDPGYAPHLDDDNDGIACEWGEGT
jgi:hypothetical protein